MDGTGGKKEGRDRKKARKQTNKRTLRHSQRPRHFQRLGSVAREATQHDRRRHRQRRFRRCVFFYAPFGWRLRHGGGWAGDSFGWDVCEGDKGDYLQDFLGSGGEREGLRGFDMCVDKRDVLESVSLRAVDGRRDVDGGLANQRTTTSQPTRTSATKYVYCHVDSIPTHIPAR